MSRIRICFLLLAVSYCACAAPGTQAPTANAGEPGHTIWLVSHDWHAGIVLQRAEIPDRVWPAAGDFADAHYLEVGWGDRDFYQTPNPHPGILLKAALLPTASVLHLVGFSDPVRTYFPYSEIIRIDLSSAGFAQLVHTIAASFARDKAGNTRSLGPGLYGNSRFYLSGDSYHLFNTCNVWTSRALLSAGLAITPARAISVTNLMSQARKFGRVVQSGPEPSKRSGRGLRTSRTST